MPATARTDDPRLAPLLDRWQELRDGGDEPAPSDLTTDPDLLPALERAIADVLFAADALGAGPRVDAAPAGGVAGRYEVFDEPASGGMGEVYRARDLGMGGRVVAYKVMKPGRHLSPWLVDLFYREAVITDAVRQPGVVPIYAKVQDDSGRPAYAMEFVEGETLGRAARRVGEGAPGPGLARAALDLLRRFLDACRIVGVAHDRGFVHADLSPRNIMLVEGGRAARVVDWGSALGVGPGADPCPARPVTPGYADPSLAPGEPPTPAADVYALGVCLGTLVRALDAVAEPLVEGRSRSSSLRALGAIAAKAAAARPADRYAGAAMLADDLQGYLSGRRVTADLGEPFRERAWRWISRHRAGVSGAVAFTILAAVSLALLTYAIDRAALKEKEARNSREIALYNGLSATLTTCQMLASEVSALPAEDVPIARFLLDVLNSKGRNPEAVEATFQAIQGEVERVDRDHAKKVELRRKDLMERLDRGLPILETLIREYPERDAPYRVKLAQGYLALAYLGIGRLPDPRKFAETMGEVLAGRGDHRLDRANYEEALVVADRALATLAPIADGAGRGPGVRDVLRNAWQIRFGTFCLLGRCTEALQALDGLVAAAGGAENLPLAGLRMPLRLAAEMEQSHMPWSGPKDADHAKAVRMADYLAAHEGVSDAAVFNAACALSLASRDPKADAAERRRRADRAMAYLVRIADAGYFQSLRLFPLPPRNTIKELNTDYALDPLRDRPDFQALIGRYPAAK